MAAGGGGGEWIETNRSWKKRKLAENNKIYKVSLSQPSDIHEKTIQVTKKEAAMKVLAYLDCVVETARYKQFPKTENGISIKPTYITKKIRSQLSNSISSVYSGFQQSINLSFSIFSQKLHEHRRRPNPVFRIRIRIHFSWLDPDPNWECRSKSGSRRAKITHKKGNFLFCSAGCLFCLRG